MILRLACLSVIFALGVIPVNTQRANAAEHPSLITDIPQPFSYHYGAYWTAVRMADITLTFDGTSLSMDIDSLGLVKQFTKYESTAKSIFAPRGAGIAPVSFTTTYKRKNRTRTMNLAFAPDTGVIVGESVNPPDSRKKYPAVSAEGKQGIADPLTSILLIRQHARQALRAGETTFSFPMYDARRLSQITVDIKNKETIRLDKAGAVDTIRMTMQRTPLEGYSKGELRRMKDGQEPLITLFFSDDDMLTLVKVILDAPIGTAVLELE